MEKTQVGVGRVVALWRYPVKSMASEALDHADVSWHGVAGDRRWAFVRDDQVRSGFPWHTIRERNDMTRYRPSFVEPDRPDASVTMVRTPSGQTFDVVDDALGAELGGGARVIKNDRGVFDAMPMSLISTQAVAALGRSVGFVLDAQRFRPNLLVEAFGSDDYPEDGWVGSTLRIGSAVVRVDKRDKRCVVVNVDPVTAQRDPRVLRAMARTRDTHLGVYGSVVRPGTVAVGDIVAIDAGP